MEADKVIETTINKETKTPGILNPFGRMEADKVIETTINKETKTPGILILLEEWRQTR